MTPGEKMDPAPPSTSKLPGIALAALIVCGMIALFWPGERSGGDVAGGFLIDATGRPAPLGERLAPATLVHFWATWCPPCVTEIPAVLRLQKEMVKPGEFAVLMIAVGDSPEKVKTFLGTAADQALFDPRWEVAHRYGTFQVPETYLLVNGKVVDKFVGATEWDRPEVRERLRTRLATSR